MTAGSQAATSATLKTTTAVTGRVTTLTAPSTRGERVARARSQRGVPSNTSGGTARTSNNCCTTCAMAEVFLDSSANGHPSASHSANIAPAK
jgi:hypothetical protein